MSGGDAATTSLRRLISNVAPATREPQNAEFLRALAILGSALFVLTIGSYLLTTTWTGAVFMHAVTASNVECLNQTFYFEKHGTSIPLGSELGVGTYLVAPLSIFGETGAPYLPDQTPSRDPRAGERCAVGRKNPEQFAAQPQ